MPKSIRSRLLVQTSLSAILALLAVPVFAQSLSLLDARVVEGNAGDALLVFEARLSAPASGAVRFDFATSDGSAIAGNDYRTVSVGQLSIPAGQTRMLVSVPVNGDSEIEANEYLNATVYNVTGASVTRGAAKGLIVNDDNKMLVSAPADPGAQSGSTGYATELTSTSGDGRLVAFVAVAQDLVAGRPGNLVKNVYVRDSRTGVTTLASIAADGSDANGDSNNPVLSANGRYLVFQSAASNIVANDNNMSIDLFRRDLLTGTTTLVSVNATGTAPAGGFSVKGSISADGRYVAFQSTAADLVANIDTNGRVDAFLRDMQTGTTTLVSRDPFGTQSDPQGAYSPQISADGRFVVYDRNAMEPWRRDMQTDTFVRAVNGFGGQAPNSTCYTNAISGDGRYVVFSSWATNLVSSGSGNPQIYVSDMQTGTTRVAALMADGTPSFTAYNPSISADGRYVAFQSVSSPVGDLSDGNGKIYVRDLQANTTIKVSNNWLGSADSGGMSENPSISADGRVVSFLSLSPIMLPGDDNGREDVFRVELPQDPSLPLLSIADATIVEGDSGTRQLNFTVSLSAPATSTVAFLPSTAEGTASAGVDYLPNNWTVYIPAGQSSTTVAVDIVGDSTVEADESFNFYIDSANGVRIADGRAIGTIVNDDVPPPPSISVGDVVISEGNSGTKLATFTATLSAPAASTVSFDIATANGTALAGSDYVAASQTGLSIPAGSTSKSFTVVINGDGVVEPNETFLVNLGNVSGATVAAGQAICTITNDDTYPSLSIGDVSISEGNTGTTLATFTLTLSAVAASPVSYDIATVDGTAVAGSDYIGRSLTGQVIPTGASSATFTVAINGDTAVEANESFQVNVGNVVGAVVADGQAVGTINNDDVLPSLSIADVAISEGNSGAKLATFIVQLSAPASSPVSYSIATANGTAVAPGDYAAKSLSGQTIPTGASSASFTVSINGDTTIEPSETFLVNVSNVSGATVVDGSAVGTISTDDVLPAISIADMSIAEGNNSSKLATFTITLSAAASGPVSFNIATANGTAVAPGDYTAKTVNGVLIQAGALSTTFTVSIKGDKTVEPNETFVVNLINVTGATVADGQALGTIVNDDGAALTLSRVTTGGLYDDIDDHHGDPVLSSREYALLLLDTAQQVCARAGGATIVGVDGVENLAVLADLADTANRLCARHPHYNATLKTNGLGFLVDGATGKANVHGTQVLELATPGVNSRATSMTVLAEGHARPLTVLLAATPSTIARERVAQVDELNRQIRARLSAEPRARLVVLGATGVDGLVDLTARSLPSGVDSAERVWVSPAVLQEFEGVRLEIPGTPRAKPLQQVLQLLP